MEIIPAVCSESNGLRVILFCIEISGHIHCRPSSELTHSCYHFGDWQLDCPGEIQFEISAGNVLCGDRCVSLHLRFSLVKRGGMNNLKSAISGIRVSSVLNRDVKQYGKKHLMNDDDETCWNSDQGLPQWIAVEFESPQKGKTLDISLQFQGGFCGKDCSVEFFMDGKRHQTSPFYPDDINSIQYFSIDISDFESFDKLKILFQKSTDFFGRIIVYNLGLNLS